MSEEIKDQLGHDTPKAKRTRDEHDQELSPQELEKVAGGVGFQYDDKLGSTPIQTLMSAYNEAQILASSVLKKDDNAGNAVIRKI
jgi:hypothetical protein